MYVCMFDRQTGKRSVSIKVGLASVAGAGVLDPLIRATPHCMDLSNLDVRHSRSDVHCSLVNVGQAGMGEVPRIEVNGRCTVIRHGVLRVIRFLKRQDRGRDLITKPIGLTAGRVVWSVYLPDNTLGASSTLVTGEVSSVTFGRRVLTFGLIAAISPSPSGSSFPP